MLLCRTYLSDAASPNITNGTWWEGTDEFCGCSGMGEHLLRRVVVVFLKKAKVKFYQEFQVWLKAGLWMRGFD